MVWYIDKTNDNFVFQTEKRFKNLHSQFKAAF